MALFMIGGVRIEGAVFGNLSGGQTTTARLAVKPVLGGRQPLEKIGQGDKTFSLSGIVAPFELGGYPDVQALEKLADEAEAAFVMRGDGVALGWYVITSFRSDDSHFASRGVGRMIRVQMDLTLSDAPEQTGGARQLRSFAERMGWS